MPRGSKMLRVSSLPLMLFLMALPVLVACTAHSPSTRPTQPCPTKKEIIFARNQWVNDVQALNMEAISLRFEINLLTNHPGWTDMAVIIKARPAIAHLESKEAALRKTTAALEEWSQKWDAPAQDIYQRSSSLVSQAWEFMTKRDALQFRWSGIFATMVRAALCEDSRDRSSRSLEEASKLNDIYSRFLEGSDWKYLQEFVELLYGVELPFRFRSSPG